MLQCLTNMIFSQHRGEKEEVPVEILHKAKFHKKKKHIEPVFSVQKYKDYPRKQQEIRSTESIISQKVRKYLNKLFDYAGIKDILEKSTQEDLKKPSKPKEYLPVSIGRVNFADERKPSKILGNRKYRTTKKLSTSFRRSLIQKKRTKLSNIESLTNLFNGTSSRDLVWEPQNPKIQFEDAAKVASDINILENMKSNSFCELVDRYIKKHKKKQRKKKLKKSTRSSISSMCDRAKFLLRETFLQQQEEEEIDYFEMDQISDDEEEQILTIQDLNLLDPREDFQSVESEEQVKCCLNQQSSCNLCHSSYIEHLTCQQDYETDLELWTEDYINGLVAVEQKQRQVSKIPIKTKQNDVVEKVKVLTDTEQQMDDEKLRKILRKTQNNKRMDKIQDIQNYINSMIPPEDTFNKPKKEKRKYNNGDQKQSIQELKKFQRELKHRIKELERKIPTPKTPKTLKHRNTSSSDHDLSFVNLSNEDINEPTKVVNNYNQKNTIKYGDKFCECCFVKPKKFPKDLCRRCNKKVYLVERICAGGGIYHNYCYNCYYCKRNLNSLNLCVTKGEIFCTQCFKKCFGPEIYGFVN